MHIARKKGSTDYPQEGKRQALSLYLEEGLSSRAITAALEIRDPKRVQAWVTQYRLEREAFFPHRRPGRPRRAASRAAPQVARTVKYRLIYQHRQQYSLVAMCHFFEISRSAYYAWLVCLNQPDPDAERLTWVQQAYQASRQTYGYRRIQLWLQREHGVHLNHKTVLRLMRKLGIQSVVCKRKS